MSEPTTLGGRIAQAREEQGVNQSDLAQQVLGSTRAATVSDWEHDRRVPDTRRLTRIAEVLGVSVGWLLTGEEGEEGAAPIEGLGDLWQRIDAIQAMDISPTVKVLMVEALSAALRAEAANAEARAAEVRGRALEREGVGAEGRARAVEEEARGASERARALHGGKVQGTAEEWDKFRKGMDEAARQIARPAGAKKRGAAGGG